MSTTPQMEASNTLQSTKPDKNILTAAKGGGIVFVGQMFAYASRFVIAFLVARLLGAEEFGLYSLTGTVATVASGLALLGLDSALVRYVAILKGQRDEAGIWGSLQIALGVTGVLGILMGIGLYALSNFIAVQVFDEPGLAPLLRLISVVVPFLTLTSVLSGAIRGFKNMRAMVIAEKISQPGVRMTLIVVFAIIGLNAVGALIIFGIGVLVAFGLLLYFLNKDFPLKRPMNTARRDTKEMLNFSIPVYLSELMITFRSNVQTILLGALDSVTTVGIFSVASRINLIGSMFHDSVTAAAKPIVAELYGRGEWEQMGRLYQTTTKWVVTLNLPVFLTIMLFSKTILSIFGKSFTDGSTALILLTWVGIVNAGTGMCGAVLDMTGYSKLKLFNSIVRLVLALSLNVLLIPRWGMVGAATTALIVTSTTNGLRLLQVFILLRLLPYNLSFLKPITAGLTTLIVILAIGQWLPVEANPIYAIIQIFILFSVYIGLILLLRLSPEDRLVLARLRQRAGKTLSRR